MSLARSGSTRVHHLTTLIQSRTHLPDPLSSVATQFVSSSTDGCAIEASAHIAGRKATQVLVQFQSCSQAMLAPPTALPSLVISSISIVRHMSTAVTPSWSRREWSSVSSPYNDRVNGAGAGRESEKKSGLAHEHPSQFSSGQRAATPRRQAHSNSAVRAGHGLG